MWCVVEDLVVRGRQHGGKNVTKAMRAGSGLKYSATQSLLPLVDALVARHLSFPANQRSRAGRATLPTDIAIT